MATQQRDRNSFGSNLADSTKDTANKAGDWLQANAEKAGDKAKDTANQAGDNAKDVASQAGDMAKDFATRTGELAKDVAGRAGDFVQTAASTVAQKSSDAASYVAHKATDATSALGGNFKSVANSIRENGPQGGIFGTADTAVANTLESCGSELEQGFSVMAEDLTNTIRKHPIPSVLIGIGIGYLAARALSR